MSNPYKFFRQASGFPIENENQVLDHICNNIDELYKAFDDEGKDVSYFRLSVIVLLSYILKSLVKIILHLRRESNDGNVDMIHFNWIES